MTNIHHFYHAYSKGNWQIPLEEHIRALKQYGLMKHLKSFNIGLVGPKETRKAVKSYLHRENVKFKVCTEVEDGWEQETMDALHAFSKKNDGYVVYAHTKNAVNINPLHVDWRKSMTYYTIVLWEQCVKNLNEGASAVGTHYLQGPQFTNKPSGFFGGTFWWTNLKYIRKFPVCERNNRFDAEGWIGNLLPAVESYGETFKIVDFNPTHPAAHYAMVTDW
jgi:hypothetical protein